MTSISLLSKLRCREGKSSAQGHTVWKQSNWVLNLDPLYPQTLFLTTTATLCPSHNLCGYLSEPQIMLNLPLFEDFLEHTSQGTLSLP